MTERGAEGSEPEAFPPEGPIPVVVPGDLLALIPMFLENRKKELARLREAVGSGDAATLEDVAHQMKGIGGGYGFAYVTTAGAAMESLAREGRVAAARPWLDALEDYLNRVSPRAASGED